MHHLTPEQIQNYSKFSEERGFGVTPNLRTIGDQLPGAGYEVSATKVTVAGCSTPVFVNGCGKLIPAQVETPCRQQTSALLNDVYHRLCSLIHPCCLNWNLRALGAEFLGVFILVLFSVVPVVEVGTTTLAIAICLGATLGALVGFLGPCSWALFNPAVTVSFAMTQKLGIISTLMYLLVQIAASFLGGLMAWVFVSSGSGMGTPVLTLTQGLGFVGELVGTTILCVTYLFTYENSVNSSLTIGLIMIGLKIFFIPLTGGCFNFFTYLGVAVISGIWTDWWVYLVANLVAPICATAIYLIASFLGGAPTKLA